MDLYSFDMELLIYHCSLYLWLFRVAADLFGKISQDHHPERGTQLHKYCRNADQLKSMFALHHCWRQTKEGTPTRCPKLCKQTLFNCSKMWMNLWQWFGPYVHQGSKGREMGHKLQRSCRKSYEKGQGLDCSAKLKDLSSNLWTKWTAASTSGFSPFSPRWCWWSLWADNWNESRADFNIVAWKF